MSTVSDILIRSSRPADESALRRLAALDSQRLPDGDFYVAEADGEVIAAYSREAARAIADPFRRTDDVVSLLKVRAGAAQAVVPAPRAHFLAAARAA